MGLLIFQKSEKGIFVMAGILISGLRALLQSRQVEEKKTNWESYASVLRAIADGEQLDPSEVALSLELVGRSVDDLEGDLELYRRRLEWRADLDRLPGLRQELASAVKVHETLKAEWERIVPVLDAKIQAAHVARQAVESMINTAAMAEGKLRSEVMNNALVEQEQRLVKRRAGLMAERRDRREKVDAELANASYAASCAVRQPEHAHYHRELEQAYRDRSKAFGPHIERVETELASVESELEKIRLAKLQP